MHGSEHVLNDSANVGSVHCSRGQGDILYACFSIDKCLVFGLQLLQYTMYNLLKNPLRSSLQWFADVNSTTLIQIQRQMRSNLTNTFPNQLPLNTVFTKRCKILQ